MTETLNNNGNYVTLLVSYGKNRMLPMFVASYFEWYKNHSGGMVRLLQTVKHPETKDSDNLYTFILTIDEDLSPANFEEYMTAMLDNDVIPYLIGSKMTPENVSFVYAIPDGFKGVATGGDIDVAIYGKELSPYMIQIFQDIFGFNEEELERAGDMFEFIGEYRIQKCLKTEDKNKFDYLMNKFSIKYELYK